MKAIAVILGLLAIDDLVVCVPITFYATRKIINKECTLKQCFSIDTFREMLKQTIGNLLLIIFLLMWWC